MRSFINFGNVQGVAVCDVDKTHRLRGKEHVDKKNDNKGCAAYNDYRELVARTDIDAVFCGTPDHWHAMVTIAAMRNGKDVYCEKPESLTIREGQRMVETARRYGRIFSGGSQRVWGDYNYLHRMARSGALGQIKEVFVNVGGPSNEMLRPAMPVPPTLDWDTWLGPAPWREYHKDYHPYRWRGCRDFSGGGMTDWGAHSFGGALFACGLHETGPLEVHPPDGKDYQRLTYVFENGIRMYHGGGWDRISAVGTEGGSSERGPKDKSKRKNPPDIHIPNYKGKGGIFGDFVHCVGTRERPFRDIQIAHRTLIVCHLGNIAYWLKRSLKWDPVKEEIIGDPEANRWLDRPKRAPWRI
jgi:predicted dehydrogenase